MAEIAMFVSELAAMMVKHDSHHHKCVACCLMCLGAVVVKDVNTVMATFRTKHTTQSHGGLQGQGCGIGVRWNPAVQVLEHHWSSAHDHPDRRPHRPWCGSWRGVALDTAGDDHEHGVHHVGQVSASLDTEPRPLLDGTTDRRIRTRLLSSSCFRDVLERSDAGSEAVLWVDERPAEFGQLWPDVAHVHDQSPLSVPFC